MTGPSAPVRVDRARLGAAAAEAAVTMLAALATLACVLALAPAPGPAVLGVVLCLTLARSQLERDRRGRIEAALALPLVGIAALGIGMLLHRAPWAGAALFTGAIAASIWLRRFGPTATRLGSLIALPFVALLVTPRIEPVAGPVPPLLVPVVVGALALFWVGVLHALAVRLGVLDARPPVPAPRPDEGAERGGGMRPRASTRMACQMAAALGLSFALGMAFFGTRWSWIVLTAFIVSSGNRGRLDVAYKSMLRVVGAAGGTLVSLALSRYAGVSGAPAVALIMLALFCGVWLRPFGYAWWALFVTIAFALLQGFSGAPAAQVLAERMEEIVLGAVVAVACAAWVLPVSAADVLRRRLADALAALAQAFEAPSADGAAFLTGARAVEQMAPAWRAWRAVARRWQPDQPADWIDALLACRAPAAQLLERGAVPVAVRRALGAARRALREPEQLGAALGALRAALEEAARAG